MKHYDPGCVHYLMNAGFTCDDANALRRISMTLHRWHELECGDSNDYYSFALVRGRKVGDQFEHDDGKPYIERHENQSTRPDGKCRAYWSPIADKERGALRRLNKIMARYPGFRSYVQGDPRGCALYILRPDDVREGDDVSSVYTRGIAVHK
jgi:hypothetical protein